MERKLDCKRVLDTILSTGQFTRVKTAKKIFLLLHPALSESGTYLKNDIY